MYSGRLPAGFLVPSQPNDETAHRQCLVILDSDGQHSPDEIPLLVAAMRELEADMMVGSRFRDAEQLAKIPQGRRMGLRAVTHEYPL